MDKIQFLFLEFLVNLLLYVLDFIKEMVKRYRDFYMDFIGIFDLLYGKGKEFLLKYFKLYDVYLEIVRLDG